MELAMCCIRDVKSEIYGRPFFTQSVGVAIRSFDDEVNRDEPDNVMYHHPDDFSLFQLGFWRDHDATFEIILPKLIIQASDVKKFKLGRGVSKT